MSELLPDFLLELRSEEIPARMQAGARAELERLFRREMSAAGIEIGELTVWSTPRRLALIARGLPNATEPVQEEAKGPPEGAPDQAVEGFCRKNGITRDQLELRDIKGRPTWFAVIERPGRATRDLLAEAIPAIIREFSWPKSMRWGAASISSGSVRWVRPLSGIVALFGDERVECEVHGVTSGWVTLGHRSHHSGDITIGSANDYAEKLRACHVIVDHEERAATIRAEAHKAASAAGLALVEDEGLVVENAGLTEWPVPLLGRFDEDFLDVPPEVIQLTARVNQKYFVCTRAPAKVEASGGGAPSDEIPACAGTRQLANAFICTANIEAEDGGAAIVDGNRKVLAARLADARFFWEQDRKKTLAEHAKGLARITFHEKLGTVADKAERVAKLARWLVESEIVVPAEAGTASGGAPSQNSIPASAGITKRDLADLAEQAARLAKADLVTEMVGEFPELQGIMGGYYARAEGLSDEVAGAIRDHYKPVGQGDEVPSAPLTVAVSLADKLDTLHSFFSIDEKPTGSKDPFALRRAALGLIRLLETNSLRLNLSSILPQDSDTRTNNDLVDFLADRLKVQQREAGVRHDLIDAVFSLGGEDDLVRLLARVKALQNYVETAEGANLLAAYKRAANILKKEDWPKQAPPFQGRGRSAEGAEGAGDVSDSSRLASPHPAPSPEREGLNDGDDIPETGEEDPLALVDDPDLRAVVDAKLHDAQTRKLPYTPAPAEQALIEALDAAERKVHAAIGDERFEVAMAALASLRAPIDAFFDDVTVNDEDEAKRAARLNLLQRFRDAVHQVANFSKVEG